MTHLQPFHAALLALTLASCASPAFQFSDPDAFKIDGDELVLHKASKYRAKVRSPHCIALIDGREYGDFVLRLEAMQTGKDVPHRDLCFFFGVESASRFYYVHISKTADPHANNIFRVADKPRIAIAEQTNNGNDWGNNEWHKIKIERELPSGAIRVYFDDMENPIMRGTDKTFGWGMIGVGSFDDAGRYRNITVGEPTPSRKTSKKIFRSR